MFGHSKEFGGHTFVEPKSNFNEEIPDGLDVHKIIYIQGDMKKNAKNFTINLLNGEKEKDGVVFHFDVRPEESVVVRNHMAVEEKEAKWGPEERHGVMPFAKAAPFDVFILVEEDNYKVAINGLPYITFSHRLPFRDVKRLNVYGDVSLSQIRFLKTNLPSGAVGNDENWQVAPPPIIRPKVPFTTPIGTGHLTPGSTIYIQGEVEEKGKNFVINLKTGLEAEDNIAFHFNPRFPKDSLVINSYENSTWGREEEVFYFPFIKGQSFEIEYLLNDDHYRVSLNGKPVLEFLYRMKPELVKYLHVEGDVRLLNVWFKPPQITVASNTFSADSGCMECFCYDVKIPEKYNFSPRSVALTPPVYEPCEPFAMHIPGGIAPGRLIVIQAEQKFGEKFEVNLQTDRESTAKPYPDVGLGLSVRLKDGERKEVVVRSYRLKGEWDAETEKHVKTPFFPFKNKNVFDLVIFCQSDGYYIGVDGQDFWEYPYYLKPLSAIDTLVISGDIKIKYVCIQ